MQGVRFPYYLVNSLQAWGNYTEKERTSALNFAEAAKAAGVERIIYGEQGYFYGNILWQIRGWIDRLIGRVGLSRGRRCPVELRVGDALDFWRVEA
jgi:hypothetical protein